jgi:hypothetical protein
MRSRLWVWIATGTVLVALGSASLGFAFANRNYAEPASTAGWTNYVPLDEEGQVGVGFSFDVGGREPCYECVDPTPWYAAGGALLGLAAVPFLLAVRRPR